MSQNKNKNQSKNQIKNNNLALKEEQETNNKNTDNKQLTLIDENDSNNNNNNNNNETQKKTRTAEEEEALRNIPEEEENSENDYEEDEEEVKKREQKKRNLMFEQKEISPLKLYCHTAETCEKVLMFFGLIGALGSGVAAPLLSYLVGDTFNDFAGVNEDLLVQLYILYPDTAAQMIQSIMDEFAKNIDDMVLKVFIIGTAMFFAFFINKFFWSYSGMRQIHHLKEKYFALILNQEQGWFDENNAYEFATKVQAQLEQIALGVGEKAGLVFTLCAQLLVGIIISFYKSWLITVVMLATCPLIFLCVLFLVCALKKVMIASRKSFEKAGGVAEEVLYNIKTVCSFSNFEFEIERFNYLIDKTHEYNKEKALKLGISIGGALFFIYVTFFIAIAYARVLIADKKKNDNTGEAFTTGDIIICVFCTLLAVLSVGTVAPNIKIIQESAIASSDYFTLYEREPKIDLTNSTYKCDRNEIKGLIEFKDVEFVYPSDVNERKILKGINLTFEPGKKIALVGESGCGKSTTVNLIIRLYEATGGQVLIDGRDIKEYDIGGEN